MKLSSQQLREVCLAAVKKNGLALQYIPNEMRDFEVCLESVNQNSNAFEHIGSQQAANLTDKEYKEICLTAIKSNANVLKFIPKDKCDFEIYLESVKKSSDAFKLIGNYHETKLTENEYIQICLTTVKQDGLLLKEIPKEIRYFDIYIESINKILMHLSLLGHRQKKTYQSQNILKFA